MDARKEWTSNTARMAEVSFADAAKTVSNNVEEMWQLVEKTSLGESFEVLPVKNRRGWRTVRIFVSSTFRDFLSEREVLVKELFPGDCDAPNSNFFGG